MIEAPRTILGYLCSMYNLQNVPVGSRHVNDFIEEIPSSIRTYYTGKYT